MLSARPWVDPLTRHGSWSATIVIPPLRLHPCALSNVAPGTTKYEFVSPQAVNGALVVRAGHDAATASWPPPTLAAVPASVNAAMIARFQLLFMWSASTDIGPPRGCAGPAWPIRRSGPRSLHDASAA